MVTKQDISIQYDQTCTDVLNLLKRFNDDILNDISDIIKNGFDTLLTKVDTEQSSGSVKVCGEALADIFNHIDDTEHSINWELVNKLQAVIKKSRK